MEDYDNQSNRCGDDHDYDEPCRVIPRAVIAKRFNPHLRLDRNRLSSELRDVQEEMAQERIVMRPHRSSSIMLPTVIGPKRKLPRISVESGQPQTTDVLSETGPPEKTARRSVGRGQQPTTFMPSEIVPPEKPPRRNIERGQQPTKFMPSEAGLPEKPPRRNIERGQQTTTFMPSEIRPPEKPARISLGRGQLLSIDMPSVLSPIEESARPRQPSTTDVMTDEPQQFRVVMPHRLNPRQALVDRMERMEREGRTFVPLAEHERQLPGASVPVSESNNQNLVGVDPFCQSPLVYSLNTNNYTNFLDQKSAALVMFYKPIMSSCVKVKKHFVKAAQSTQRENSAFAAVDCSVEADLCLKQSITTLPSFKLYSQGAPVNTFKDKIFFNELTLRKLMKNAPPFNRKEGVTRPSCNPWMKETIRKITHEF